MTSLFLSTKLHSTTKISASSIAAMSRGCLHKDQITKMEMCLIRSLSWHLNPPTPSQFLAVAHPFVATSNVELPHDILDLARYLAELAVCDGFFIDKKPSSIARASLQVAFEITPQSGEIENFCLDDIDKSPRQTELCALRLRRVFRLSVMARPEGDGEEDLARNSSSPTSVVE